MSLETKIKVGFLGVSEKDITKFVKIFRFSRPDKRSYCVENNIDDNDVNIIIVNTRLESANEQYKHFQSTCPSAALVTIGPNQSAHHLSGMLLASRIYMVLDQVTIQQVKKAKEQEPVTDHKENKRIQSLDTQPISDKLDQPETVTQKVAVAAEPTEDTSCRVLVVDDSELMQKAVLFELEKVECKLNIDVASSGEEAMQRIDENKYDIVFMDVMMPLPGMDGFEACTKIRKIPEMKKTPIIMLTSKTSPLDEVKGIVSGCTTYLTKPIKPDDFLAMMNRVLLWLDNSKKDNKATF